MQLAYKAYQDPFPISTMMTAPFRYINIPISELNGSHFSQIAQFRVYKNYEITAIFEIMCNSDNTIYILLNDRFMKANRNNVSIHLMLYNIYSNCQADISITHVYSNRDNVGINTIHDLVTDKQPICHIIDSLGADGLFQGDIYLN